MKKFDNFCRNLHVLEKAYNEDLENEFIQSGIIDKFFIQFELSWKLLKELLRYEGNPMDATGSPREILKAAYACYDFVDEEIWLDMLRNRNDLTHIYDSEKSKRLVRHILDQYIPTFQKLGTCILEKYGEELKRI
jgi:nucleotidyltransferase substrate binding protein (TIGR01987 family)